MRVFWRSIGLLVLAATGVRAELALNEVLPNPQGETLGQVYDADRYCPPWIEIWNYGATTENLAGCGLSDGATRWTFPATNLAPNSFLLVFASGKDRTNGELHASFWMPPTDGTVILTGSASNLLDVVSYGKIPMGASLGRAPDNVLNWVYYTWVGYSGMPANSTRYPSPRAANPTGYFASVAAPVQFTPAPGALTGINAIAMQAAETNGAIIYSSMGDFNNTATAPGSGLYYSYAAPVPVYAPTSVPFLARAVVPGKIPGNIGVGLYFSTGAVDFASSTLPIVVIDTAGAPIPDEPKITASMGIIDNGAGRINYLTNAFNGYAGQIGIETRGQTSQTLSPKKPYALQTRTAGGVKTDASLLGLPAENDWALIAPFFDKALIRNAMVYELGAQAYAAAGRYVPQFRFCEVILNGDYQGVYVLTETIKRSTNRVDLALTAAATPATNSGYLLEMKYRTKLDPDDVYLRGLRSGFDFIYKYPKAADISSDQLSYIKYAVTNFEQVLYASPASGAFFPLIDSASFVDYILLQEVAKNNDAYWASNYLYKEGTGPLVMGPLWDFDIAMGNTWWGNYETNALWLPTREWAGKLLSNTNFFRQYVTRYAELRKDVLSHANIDALVTGFTNELGGAAARNYQKWPVLGQYVWPNHYVGPTYAADVAYLRDWLHGRIGWLDGQWRTNVPVQADFAAPGTVEVGKPVTFVNRSTFNTTAWKWDFSNDGTWDSTDWQPTNIYAAAGWYTVRLQASGGSLGTNLLIRTNALRVTLGPDPALGITSTVFAVAAEISAAPLSGWGSNLAGQIAWSTDRGAAGTAPAASNWSFWVNGLLAGTNWVTLLASNNVGESATARVALVRSDAAFLSPGDVVLLRMNNSSDGYTFMPLRDLPPYTELKFTDSGWLSPDGPWRATENNLVLNLGPAGLAAGVWVDMQTAGLGSGGEQIFAHTGDYSSNSSTCASARFLFGANWDDPAGWLTNGVVTNSSQSYLPFTLTNASVAVGAGRHWYYNGPIEGTPEQLLAEVARTNNWTTGDVTITNYAALRPGLPAFTVFNSNTAPVLAITNAPDWVAPSVNQAQLAGTASNLVGAVRWENDRGGSGSVPAAAQWALAVTGLQPGPNRITLSGSNRFNQVVHRSVTIQRRVPILLWPGNLAVIRVNNFDDGFTALALRDLPPYTELKFTDSSWALPDGPFWMGETIVATNTGGAGWPAGHVQDINIGAGYGKGGEQLFAFLGDYSPTTTLATALFIFGVNWDNAGWITSGTGDSKTSYLPAVLTNANVALGSGAQWYYNGPIAGTPASLLALVTNPANWAVGASNLTTYAALRPGVTQFSVTGAPPPYVRVTAQAGAHGAIDPAGEVLVAWGGGQDFAIAPEAYWHVAGILTNGGAAALSGPGAQVFAWAPVWTDGVIAANFDANTVTNGVPEWWLARHGLTNFAADALADADQDTLATWQEFWCNTDPTNGQSYLGVLTPIMAGDGVRVRWMSVTGKNYTVERAGGLTSAAPFQAIGSNVPGQAGATEYTVAGNTNRSGFYRVGVER